jgi:hypothetical protein
MTLRTVRHDITERSLAPDMIDSMLANEPIENAEQNEPTLPSDSAEPTEPIESTDPREPIHRTESLDRIDRTELPPLSMGRSSASVGRPSTVVTRSGASQAANRRDVARFSAICEILDCPSHQQACLGPVTPTSPVTIDR